MAIHMIYIAMYIDICIVGADDRAVKVSGAYACPNKKRLA